MADTVELPAGSLVLTGLTPAINVSSDNRVNMAAGSLAVGNIVPSIAAGQVKLVYNGRLSINTRMPETLGSP